MCCFFASLMFFGPRFAFLIYWIVFPLRVQLAFKDFNFPWLVGILGLAFAPWLTLMFVIIAPGGLNGFDWVWLGLALAADVAAYIGGDRNRHKVPGYSQMMPGDVPPAAPAAPAAAAPMMKSESMAAPAAPAPMAPPAMPSDEEEKK